MIKHRYSQNRNARAFTLLEFVITLTLLAVLVAWGFPSLQESIRNNRVAAQANELVALINFAKSEAVRRNTSVPIRLIPTGTGWDAIVEDPSEEADVEGCLPGQLRCTSNTGVALLANTSALVFNNRGYIRGADDPWVAEVIFLQHADCSGKQQRRRIDVRPTGQVSICRQSCDSTAPCPP